jgi:histidinol phosphatase-like enzyme (inositol monophosphatase family)
VPQPSLKDLLSLATEAAYLAGRRTLAYFNTGVEVETKKDDTPVTRADREAEQVIRQIIGRHYPDHAILGEEQGGDRQDRAAAYRWIIDPIDGTKSFIHGVPLYGVLIGVEIRGVASVGVVYHPALDEMVTAAIGMGCSWNGRPARVSNIASLSQATLLCGSPVAAMRRSDAFEKLAGMCKLTRGWGDCYGHILVATGRAEIMLDPAMNPWDCAPLLPILHESGGHFTTWSDEATIWGPDAVSTNAAVHGEVMAVLRGEQRR